MSYKRKRSKDGSLNVTDEQFNTISHLFGFVLSLLGSAYLIVYATMHGNIWQVISFSLFGFSLIFLYVFSTLHHGLTAAIPVEKFLRTMDYNAIYLIIAATYTPICLIVMRDALGWSVLGISWLVALGGIVLRTVNPDLPQWVVRTIYVAMALFSLTLVYPLYLFEPYAAYLFVLGLLIYGVGSLIYIFEWPNIIFRKFGFHEIWHIFVLLATAAHYALMHVYLL